VKHVRAWCNRELEGDENGSQDARVTHGICPECEAFFDANKPKSLRQFLNTIDAPVLCLDEAYCAITANDAACELLGKSLDEIADHLCGSVLECVWSRRPGGCGQTEHCLGCAIRRGVLTTFEFGRGLVDQPAYVDLTDADGNPKRQRLSISTERRNEVILLRIDEATP
jgi:PAS domain-containing protein